MPDDKKVTAQSDQTLLDAEAEARREFLKSIARGTAKGVAVAPAVAMLLGAVSRPMKAHASYHGCGCGSIL
jgi:hypothetical protein